jgi:hypothetical protein
MKILGLIIFFTFIALIATDPAKSQFVGLEGLVQGMELGRRSNWEDNQNYNYVIQQQLLNQQLALEIQQKQLSNEIYKNIVAFNRTGDYVYLCQAQHLGSYEVINYLKQQDIICKYLY